MNDAIGFVEKIVQYKDFIFNDRFIWIFVFVLLAIVSFYLKQYDKLTIFTIISFILAYNAFFMYPWEKSYLDKISDTMDYDSKKSTKLIDNKFLFISYKSQINYELLKIRLNILRHNPTKDSFESLGILEKKKLLKINGEYAKYLLAKANFYIEIKNIKLLKDTLSKIDSSTLSHRDLFVYSFQQSFLHEFNGDMIKAKDILLHLLEYNDINKATLFNNIARLEELNGNSIQALHYYEKAYDELLLKPSIQQVHIVLSNLVLIYAKDNKYDTAREWLNKYEQLIDKNILEQYLEFLNIQIQLARQSRDRILLIDAYAKMGYSIEPKLTRDEFLANFTSKLRMSYNDNVSFEENIISSRTFFEDIRRLDFPKNYFATKEIFHMLKELNMKNQNDKYVNNYFNDVSNYLFTFDNTIIEYRKTIHDLSIWEHFFWMQEENFVTKINFVSNPTYDKFKHFFEELEQLSKYSKEYENSYLQMKANMMICDEFIAYSQVLNKGFADDFKQNALESLNNAERLMKENVNNNSFVEYIVPLGYYIFILENDKKKALEYLELFKSKNINILHYANWIKVYYNELHLISKTIDTKEDRQ
ncbi:MAG: tetratricopeptide repeat protein [Campylobacterota bacterium]|nr:tetratricopeptide repeat protein [Campylobacterota bacterium]